MNNEFNYINFFSHKEEEKGTAKITQTKKCFQTQIELC